MAKSTLVFRQTFLNRPSRRHITGSSSTRTSTSPQRRNAVAEPVASTASVKPFSAIPGPIALPMLRHHAHILPRIGNFHHTVGLGLLEGLREKYGDLVRLAKASRNRPVLYVFDPEIMREVYESCTTEGPRFEKSPLDEHRKNIGSCPMHGDQSQAIWAAVRALLQDRTLLRSFDDAFDDIAADLTRRLGDLRHAENALNDELETEIYRWAIETTGMMIFGIRMGCLDGAAHVPTPETRTPEKTSVDDEIPELCSLTKRCLEELTPGERMVRYSREIADGSFLVRSEGTLKPDSKTFNSALKAFDRHFSLTEHFLSRAMESLNCGTLRPEQILLDKLRPLDSRILPLAANILLAGVDPLAQTALSMFHQLALNAARQQRAHDEVIWSKEAKETGDTPDLSYITACAREAMRLHPVTGGVVRRTKEDLVVAGFEVPAGVDIVLAHGVSSRSEKQWGRANSFVPERWCSEGWEPLKASRAHPLASMPFGETCPASGIAGKMLASLAARVLEKFRVEWHGPMPNVTTTGVNRIQPPYYFVLQNAH